VAKRSDPSHQINAAQHRVALTRVYLKMACPDIDHSARASLADTILALIASQESAVTRRKIADAQVVEMVWAHSQCVLNQTGRCPLLIFGGQLAEEVNAYFNEEE
jgi:hypothetical protein